MRIITVAAACALMCCALFAQAPAKTGGVETQLSAEEQNIRTYIELLRTDLRKSKSQVMSEVMRLEAAEAQKFWTVYKDFEAELTKLGDQIVALVSNYSNNYNNLTDATADKLAMDFLSIEQQRNALKKKYYTRMKASLGGITAMRFLQVENQLERLLDLQLAAQLPVASAE